MNRDINNVLIIRFNITLCRLYSSGIKVPYFIFLNDLVDQRCKLDLIKQLLQS